MVMPDTKTRRRARAKLVLAQIHQVWPDLFAPPLKPLAIGIHKGLRGTIPGVSGHELRDALRVHTRKADYLTALAAGGQRYGLDGEACGIIVESAQKSAAAQLLARRGMRPAADQERASAGS